MSDELENQPQSPLVKTNYEPETTNPLDTLKNLSENHFLKENDKKDEFYGVVLGVQDNKSLDRGTGFFSFWENKAKSEKIVYVRIEDIHAHLPNPFGGGPFIEQKNEKGTTVDSSDPPINKKLVTLHSKVSYSRFKGGVALLERLGKEPKFGDYVKVKFEDKINYEGGFITENLGPSPITKILENFDPESKPFVQGTQGSTEDGNGGLKTNNWEFGLKPHVLSVFPILDQEARRDKIFLRVTNGFRSPADQARIMYNNYWRAPGGGTPASREAYLRKLYKNKKVFPRLDEIIKIFNNAGRGTRTGRSASVPPAAVKIIESWPKVGHLSGESFDLGFKRVGFEKVEAVLRRTMKRVNIRVVVESDHFHISVRKGGDPSKSTWKPFRSPKR